MNAPLAIGMIALVIGIWHEISWWNRRNWRRMSGVVIDIHEKKNRGKTDYYPVISYMASEGERKFTSKYGGNTNPAIGEGVIVLVAPDGGSQEHYSKSNRWLISAIAFCMGFLLVIKGIVDLQA